MERLKRIFIQITGNDSFLKVRNDNNIAHARQTRRKSEERPSACKQIIVSQDQCTA